MRRTVCVAAVAVAAGVAAPIAAAVAAPAAPAAPATPAAPAAPSVPGTPGQPGGEATPGAPSGPGAPTTPTDPPPPPPAPTAHVVWGCLTQHATASGATMRVIWGNGDMRAALAGARTVTVGIDAGTAVRAGWPWARRPWGASRGGGVAGLRAGDIVAAFITATPGTPAAALPAAHTVLDFGRNGRTRGCAGR